MATLTEHTEHLKSLLTTLMKRYKKFVPQNELVDYKDSYILIVTTIHVRHVNVQQIQTQIQRLTPQATPYGNAIIPAPSENAFIIVDFGPEAQRSFCDIADAWFSLWLKEAEGSTADWPPLQLFIMGANSWRSEHEWPLARTRYTPFYLHSNGAADLESGPGTLTVSAPAAEAPDEFDYDPRDPLMTLYTPGGQQVPLDQRALDGRHDVMIYQTPPLTDAGCAGDGSTARGTWPTRATPI